MQAQARCRASNSFAALIPEPRSEAIAMRRRGANPATTGTEEMAAGESQRRNRTARVQAGTIACRYQYRSSMEAIVKIGDHSAGDEELNAGACHQ